ncbi:MAG: anti-sigma B factor antagonist [Crocinitomix sp.]|jgi:anti-sigma B factor antagonist
MNFEQQTKEKFTLVTAHVEKLDASNAPELKALFLFLNKSSVNNIVLDLSKSKYCDSSGLSSILIGNRLCKDSGGTFVLAGLQANVQKLIQISQLHNVLNIVPHFDEADAIFSK